MTPWTVIADDLTGACDTGAVFAQAGLRTRVLLDPLAPAGRSEVQVLTTESRHLPPAKAAEAVRQALEALTPAPGGRVYKKIDSTLRGQPGAELAALMERLGLERALVTPAFPGQRRVVSGGRVWVGGWPLEETVFGREAASGDLAAAFGGLPVRALGLDEVRRGAAWLAGRLVDPGVWLADAENEEDLRVLAAAARQSNIHLLCGSAGLARAVVEEEGRRERADSHRLEPADPRGGPTLVVAGSRHPATLEQVAVLEEAGLALFRPAWDDLRIANRGERTAEALARVLAKGRGAVLSAAGLTPVPGDERAAASGLAALACAALLQTGTTGGLALTGGDTAAAVCRSLGCPAIDLGGEILPGLGWGWLAGGKRPGLPVATKAGGFGGSTALVEAVEFLSRARRMGHGRTLKNAEE